MYSSVCIHRKIGYEIQKSNRISMVKTNTCIGDNLLDNVTEEKEKWIAHKTRKTRQKRAQRMRIVT